MLSVLAAASLLLVACALCGAAICHACGFPARAPWGPAVGFSALLEVGGTTALLPGRAVTAAAAVAGALLVSVGYLGRRRILGPPPAVALATAALVVLVAMLPLWVSGRGGLLGVGTNDDLSEHLLAAWTLTGQLAADANKLIQSGYPLGPHALAATLSELTGMSLERAFTGLMVAIPALLALAATGFLRSGPRVLRVAAAAAVGLCYLQSAYVIQASFKEPMEATILVAFAAGLQELTRRPSVSRLRLVPVAVLGAGSVCVYSYAGLLWPAGAALLWVAAGLAVGRGRRRRWRGRRRETPVAALAARGPAWSAVAVGAVSFAVMVAPEIGRMIRFAKSGYNHEAASVLGNLLHPLSPLEAIGVWPRLDFRFDVPLGSLGGVLALVALAALLGSVGDSLRRRELVLPAALLAAAGLYAVNLTRNPYSAAKALAIAAPLATLVLAAELLFLFQRRSTGALRAPAAVLGLVLLAGAYSDLELLRDGPVGPPAHPGQLSALRDPIGRHPTLYLGSDDFVLWELRGASIWTPPRPLYARAVVPLRREKAQPGVMLQAPPSATDSTDRFAGLGLAFDFDSVTAAVLDRFTYVILPRSGYASAPPPNWRLVRTVGAYTLWRRSGATAPRYPLTEIDDPGATLDCTSPAGRRLARDRGYAFVRSAPVIGERTRWRGRVGYAGGTASQRLKLGRGTWEISLQYDSASDVVVRGPRLRAIMPAALEPLGPYWLVGEIRLARPQRVRISVTSRALSMPARIVGALGMTRAPTPTGLRPLGRVVAARPPDDGRLIALHRACGRYVDWFRPAGGARSRKPS